MIPANAKQLEVTDWYPGTDKPVRSGVYERDYGSTTAFCHFDITAGWSAGYIAVKTANNYRQRAPDQCLPWRGVQKFQPKPESNAIADAIADILIGAHPGARFLSAFTIVTYKDSKGVMQTIYSTTFTPPVE